MLSNVVQLHDLKHFFLSEQNIFIYAYLIYLPHNYTILPHNQHRKCDKIAQISCGSAAYGSFYIYLCSVTRIIFTEYSFNKALSFNNTFILNNIFGLKPYHLELVYF